MRLEQHNQNVGTSTRIVHDIAAKAASSTQPVIKQQAEHHSKPQNCVLA
jgi:hypothetical protein